MNAAQQTVSKSCATCGYAFSDDAYATHDEQGACLFPCDECSHASSAHLHAFAVEHDAMLTADEQRDAAALIYSAATCWGENVCVDCDAATHRDADAALEAAQRSLAAFERGLDTFEDTLVAFDAFKRATRAACERSDVRSEIEQRAHLRFGVLLANAQR
jgi:hypothetical protein